MNINRYHVRSATEIVTTMLDIPKNGKQKCIDEAYRIGDKQNQKTNVKAIMSSWTIWEETSAYNGLLDIIITQISISLSPLYDSMYEYVLTNAWTAIYKEGHYTQPHTHWLAQTSFVYYVKADVGSSPLIFDKSDLHVAPCDGLLVVFPSYLEHSVPVHRGEDRICLAGNLDAVMKSNA